MPSEIVGSVDVPESGHLELNREGDAAHVYVVGPKGGYRAWAKVSLADLKAAIERLEKGEG